MMGEALGTFHKGLHIPDNIRDLGETLELLCMLGFVHDVILGAPPYAVKTRNQHARSYVHM